MVHFLLCSPNRRWQEVLKSQFVGAIEDTILQEDQFLGRFAPPDTPNYNVSGGLIGRPTGSDFPLTL